MFYLDCVVECIGDINKCYSEMSAHLREVFPVCTVNDFFWETDEDALRLEMARTRNTKCEGQETLGLVG